MIKDFLFFQSVYYLFFCVLFILCILFGDVFISIILMYDKMRLLGQLVLIMVQKEGRFLESFIIEDFGQLCGQLLGFWFLNVRSNILKEIWGSLNRSYIYMIYFYFEISNKKYCEGYIGVFQ